MKQVRKLIGLCFATLLLVTAIAGCGKDVKTETQPQSEDTASTESKRNSKILVVYFSATGNTKPIAESAAEVTGADLFEIVPSEPYSDADLNYSDDNCRANKEQNDSTARPEIEGKIDNMENYNVVLIGHPIWWGIEPRIIDTFMETYDLSGKTVANFCTSGGSGVSSSTSNLKELSPDANWLEGHRFDSDASKDEVRAWIESLELGIELQ